MTVEQRLQAIESKLDMLVKAIVPTPVSQDLEIEHECREAMQQVYANPRALQDFVKNHADWLLKKP